MESSWSWATFWYYLGLEGTRGSGSEGSWQEKCAVSRQFWVLQGPESGSDRTTNHLGFKGSFNVPINEIPAEGGAFASLYKKPSFTITLIIMRLLNCWIYHRGRLSRVADTEIVLLIRRPD